MLSEEEIQRAIDDDLSVQWRISGATYIGKIRRTHSQGLWFEGCGGRRGTESIEGPARPNGLTFVEQQSTPTP